MNRQQTIENLGEALTRILPFNQFDQRPQRSLTSALSQDVPAIQPLPKAFAESTLLLGTYVRSIQIIVGIRIQQAVSQNRRRQFHALTEQRLKSARGPRIP